VQDDIEERKVLIINLKGLIEKKSAYERRKITYKVIEQETGIKVLTLSRIASNHDYNISRKDIEKLLLYFHCQPSELFTLIPE
jgi:DNA-binding Xre family transcriptional regulator